MKPHRWILVLTVFNSLLTLFAVYVTIWSRNTSQPLDVRFDHP